MNERRFPDGFLWGAATAGHQIEGGNVNASMWRHEWAENSLYTEPSGDACDSYHRYPEDIALLADAGLNVYRFSVEWSRIEPEQGFYSNAALDHYRRMCEACHEAGVTVFLTLNHFTVPKWFAKQGGFNAAESPEWFAAFSAVVADRLGDLVSHVATFNEPNLGELLVSTGQLSKEVAKQFGTDGTPTVPFDDALANVKAAHVAAREPWRDLGIPVGWTLAMPSFHAVDGGEDIVTEKRAAAFDQFLDLSRDDDFVGVQGYSRERFGPDGSHLGPPEGVDLTETAWEVYPKAISESVRYAAEYTGGKVFVTENGMATSDDTARIAYLAEALTALHEAIDDGVQLGGYIAWTLLDNWEWMSGFAMHFGLVEVDLKTFERTPKPSLAWLGAVAHANELTEASTSTVQS